MEKSTEPVSENSKAEIDLSLGRSTSDPRDCLTKLRRGSETDSGPGSPPPVKDKVPQAPPQAMPVKKKPEDFIFGKVIGEGSFSTVFLAKEVTSKKEYAIKVCEKRLIIKEKKTNYVKRERDILSRLSNHPFFIKFYCTFQDIDRLYFVLSYAEGGELLDYITKLGCFDENATQFYSAEIVLALECLNSLGIVHRDLKPENILLNKKMHIQITDFGTAKILEESPLPTELNTATGSEDKIPKRRNSFVGTAQYVSPEVLSNKDVSSCTDLWALGCIVYQLTSGRLPFWGNHEYAIFQKINKCEYEFPEGFNPVAKDLVEKLLKMEMAERLGSPETGGIEALKSHQFFDGVNWEKLPTSQAPELCPFLPAKGEQEESFWSEYKPGLNDQHLSKLMISTSQKELGMSSSSEQEEPKVVKREGASASHRKRKTWFEKTMPKTEEERRERLETQAKENAYHRFIEGNLVLHMGLLDKRVGLFARRRMFLLTEGPHLYYVDPVNMVLKGELPWSKDLRPEPQNFKILFVHTPKRIYYLEDPEGHTAQSWSEKIQEVWNYYYNRDSSGIPKS